MTLEDRLSAGPESDYRRAQKAAHPSGWEPGIAWDGSAGQLTTGPMAEAPSTWDDLIRDWGLDPAEVQIVEPVQIRAWDSNVGGGEIKRLRYYRATIRRRASSTVCVDELVKLIKRGKARKEAPGGDLAFVAFSADSQLGKSDGGGTAKAISNFCETVDRSVDRVRELRRIGRPIGALYLPWMGDCIEGTNSQGGNLLARLDLTLTEQVRLYRRLMLHQIQTLAPLADRVVVPAIPGNHGEAVRRGNQMATRYDDSWDLEGAAAVADALKLNEDAYGHVSFVFPGRDELTITLDIGGTVTALAHGHQFRPGKAIEWWKDQSHGMQAAGDATLLATAHLHHFRVVQSGSKTWVQCPAIEDESTWWRHRKGEVSPAGVLSMTVGNGGWGDLAVL